MFKVTWVQMSQSVGECLKRLSHCIPFLQAQFHQYQRGGGGLHIRAILIKKKQKTKSTAIMHHHFLNLCLVILPLEEDQH